MPASNQQLMAWLQQVRQTGSETARSRILKEARPRILAFLTSRLESHPAPRAVAEELTQEALIKVDRGLTGCRAQSAQSFRAWQLTIARHVWIDHRRRREEEMERRDDTIPAEAIRLGREGRAREERRASVEEVDRVIGELVLQAQRELSDGTALVVRRRFLYGDTWKEAGKRIDTTEGGAQRRWQRARDRLRAELEKRIPDLPPDVRDKVRARIHGGADREGVDE